MATPSSSPIPAVPPATARTFAKPFSPIGATKTSRTTWPWSTTPSSRASPTPTNSASAAGPMAASPPTSSSLQPPRFKPAISGAGAAQFSSLYGHDQYQKDYEAELGLPWENPAAWIKVSPFRNVAKVTTPTLFMGVNIDWNVPILGGEQMYQALKRLGRTTELVVYPDEFHEFSTPSHIKDRLERDLAWYAHFVKPDPPPARPEPTKTPD